MSGYGLYADAEDSDQPGDQASGKREVVALDFDLGPEDDPGLKVMEVCDQKGLSEAGCEAVMQQVGHRFSDYQGGVRALLASMTFPQAFGRLLGMRKRSAGGDQSDAGVPSHQDM